jgi:hypothetical protein
MSTEINLKVESLREKAAHYCFRQMVLKRDQSRKNLYRPIGTSAYIRIRHSKMMGATQRK